MFILHYNVQHWCSNEVERFAPFATIWLLLIQTDWSKEPANKANYSCVLCVRWRIVHAQCALGSTMEITDALCGWTKVASFADPFQLLFAGAFYGGLFRTEDPLAFYAKSVRNAAKAIVRAVSQCSLFQWLSEGIKWNFINKGRNCLVRCGGEALSMWGFVSLSGPFQCHVCTSSCDAFASSHSRRGIPLSRATLHLPNIVFFLARIQQSLSVLKDLACILSGRTARSNKAPQAMQRAPSLCRRDL